MKKLNALKSKEFGRIAVSYADFSSPEDTKLRLLAELLIRVHDYDPLGAREAHAVGHQIIDYLNRKAVIDHYVFQRPLDSCTFDEVDLNAEIKRVAGKLG